MMASIQTIIYADQCLTATGWQSGVMISVTAEGRIGSLQSDQSQAQATQHAREHGATFHTVSWLLPAMANLHSHAFQRAFAGLTERRSPDGQGDFWTWRTQMYALLGQLQPEHIEMIAAMVQMEMLEAGFASVGEFHYLHHQPDGTPYDNPSELSERIMAAASQTGIGLTLLPVLYSYSGCGRQPLTAAQSRFGHDIDHFDRLLSSAEWAMSALPGDSRLGIAPHSLRAVDANGLTYAEAWSQQRQAPIHIHIAEQTAEVERVQASLGARPVAWLLGHVAVDARWCLVHATHMVSSETLAVAKSGAVVGLCPITEANLGDGIFPGQAYAEAGGRLGIGSDSNVLISVTQELALLEYSQRLSLRARGVLAEPGGSVGHWLWTQSCRGGAQALGRGHGEIAVGAWADLVSYRTDRVELVDDDSMIHRLNADRLLDTLIFATARPTVEHVWSAGRHCVDGGRHHQHDAIRQRYREAWRDMMTHLNEIP